MKTDALSPTETTVAATVAGEDLRCGDFIATFSQVWELPSFVWDGGDCSLRPEEMVRLKGIPCDAGQPRKVVGICLPFLYVAKPDQQTETLDLRRTQIVRLDQACAKVVWKAMKQRVAKPLSLV